MEEFKDFKVLRNFLLLIILVHQIQISVYSHASFTSDDVGSFFFFFKAASFDWFVEKCNGEVLQGLQSLKTFSLSSFQFIKESQLNSTLSSEDQNILWGLYIPVMIIGSTLNLCLLWALLSDRQLRCDPRNSFILALSFSDFLLCNFTCPVTFWSMVAGKWPFGKHTEILCKFFKAAQDFPIVMSSFCIGAIACDRHRVIIQTSSTQMNAIQVNTKKKQFSVNSRASFTNVRNAFPSFVTLLQGGK